MAELRRLNDDDLMAFVGVQSPNALIAEWELDFTSPPPATPADYGIEYYEDTFEFDDPAEGRISVTLIIDKEYDLR